MFELNHNRRILRIQEHNIGGKIIFRIMFPNGQQPLIVTRATRSNYTDFWTSIPEGRQKEAEEIGTLIAEHLKSNS